MADTPYLAELNKTYEASRYLDAKVTFVTERQILKGFLSRYKVLLIPGARNLPSPVVDAIWSYAQQGGHILIVPESLLGDEYNRPQKYLGKIGVSISRTELPKAGQKGALVQGYDQSFSREVEFDSGPPRVLQAVSAAGDFSRVGQIRSSGVMQTLKLSSGAEALFQYSDGGAAIAQTRLGKGWVYYSGSSLETGAYARLLDALYATAGVTRPVRVLEPGGSVPGRVEARLALLGGRKLVYISNYQNRPAELDLNSSAGPIHGVKTLRRGTQTEGHRFAVTAGDTEIYELF